MPVLTLEQYNKQKEPVANSLNKVKEQPALLKQEKVSVPEILYYLLHPENPKDCYLNFEDELNIDGKTYNRKCENGVVKTKEKVLKNFLVSKGYLLLEEIKQDD